MASTSTNKQPVMIDRPFHRGRLITSQVVADFRTPGNGATILLDCTENDGAIVDTAYVFGASNNAGEVALYITTAATIINVNNTNTWPVAYLNVNAPAVGGHFLLDLPELSTPVPRSGVNAKNRGILVEKGEILIGAKIGAPWPTGHFLGIQGGFL
ncbi:hypothetical protein [Synechococcus elongatus]|uniref:hypothetical protein n=1 Tax=Synechococcus elongatus TaxID=32046 RepID=UPI000F7D77F6|nr:hypothetical protein [Synechococcus elongatus]